MKPLGPLSLALAAALALAPFAASAQHTFPTPEVAGDALVGVLTQQQPDEELLTKLFGDKWRDFVPYGSVERRDVDAFLTRYRQRHSFSHPTPDTAVLTVGEDAWTLPVPMKKTADGWAFDIVAGAEVARVRRVGRGEITAMLSALAYHDAQVEYATNDHDGDGVLEYAQKLVSTDGFHDGLFWSEDDSGEISPVGPLFGDAEPGSAWHGYHFRILDGQGPSAPGGAYSYKLGDNMSRGFALIGWPAEYDDSGVMSFMISHEGVIFEKDQGPGSAAAAAAMTRFDPDDSWKEVSELPDAIPVPD